MAELTLSQLNVYPIKSARGTSVAAWEVDSFGLRHDRRWMVVDAAGRLVTQRTHPRMALARPALVDDRLRVTAPSLPPLDLRLEPAAAITTTVRIWDDVCEALWLGEHAAEWFSRLLAAPVSLVYMPESTVRPASPAYAPAGTRVSFADAYPFLLLSEESLGDLNRRMAAPLPMNRFRPNLVIAGGEPYAEDGLREFDIGRLPFRGVKLCDRCVLTTTDQDTTERGVEPLRTLATYRKWDGKVWFGQNVVHAGPGRLEVGAPVRC